MSCLYKWNAGKWGCAHSERKLCLCWDMILCSIDPWEECVYAGLFDVRFLLYCVKSHVSNWTSWIYRHWCVSIWVTSSLSKTNNLWWEHHVTTSFPSWVHLESWNPMCILKSAVEKGMWGNVSWYPIVEGDEFVLGSIGQDGIQMNSSLQRREGGLESHSLQYR